MSRSRSIEGSVDPDLLLLHLRQSAPSANSSLAPRVPTPVPPRVPVVN